MNTVSRNAKVRSGLSSAIITSAMGPATTGGSLTEFMVRARVSESVRIESLTMTVITALPKWSGSGEIVNVLPSMETATASLSLIALKTNSELSTSVADNVSVKSPPSSSIS